MHKEVNREIMKIVKDNILVSIFLNFGGNSTKLIISTVPVKIKQVAVMIFIGIHWGENAFKKVIPKIQPVMSRRADKKCCKHKHPDNMICIECGNSRKYQRFFGTLSDKISGISGCKIFKFKDYSIYKKYFRHDIYQKK